MPSNNPDGGHSGGKVLEGSNVGGGGGGGSAGGCEIPPVAAQTARAGEGLCARRSADGNNNTKTCGEKETEGARASKQEAGVESPGNDDSNP